MARLFRGYPWLGLSFACASGALVSCEWVACVAVVGVSFISGEDSGMLFGCDV